MDIAMAVVSGVLTVSFASLLGLAQNVFGALGRGPQCVPGQASPGVEDSFSPTYTRLVERTCHWNCYAAGVDFYPPPPPEYWSNGTYTVAECVRWCDALPGCTGFEYPTGCSGAACDRYPDKAIPGSYCGLFLRGMCQSPSSPGYHVSPGFDTYIRSAPALPQRPYYAVSEPLRPSLPPLPSGGGLPPNIGSLLSRGGGFAHLERIFEMTLAMDYPIFFNRSALLPEFPLYSGRVDWRLRRDAWDSISNLTDLFGQRVENTYAGWNVAAALLLALELYDPVHELVLGNQPVLPTSEVWAWLHTFQEHPESYWLHRPMSPENHYLHGILHRLEGHRLGEAGLMGFENAKFWFGGGVETPTWGLGLHPVFTSLADAVRASSHEPLRRCCLRAEDHTVMVPPGRKVQVSAGWDPFAFVDFHRAVVEGTQPQAKDIAALRWAQRQEFELLFNYSVELALNPLADPFLSGTPSMVPVTLQGKAYRLWAQRWGGGPTKILIVHGGPGCSHTAFDSLTGILSPYDYELVFFDQLGGGRSDCAAPSSPCYSSMPASIDDFVDQLEQMRVHMRLPAESTLMFGHSWGVILTLEHALRYPGAVSGYVLGGFPASMAAYMRRMRALGSRNVSDFFGSFICRARPCAPSFVWSSDQCNTGLSDSMGWPSTGTYCSGDLCGWNRWGDLGNISAPTLLLVGDHDLAAPADMRAMAGRMPDAKFVEFRDCGHAEWIDAPAAFAQSLTLWVQRHLGSDGAGSISLQSGLRGEPGSGAAGAAISSIVRLSGAGLLAGSLCLGMSLWRRQRARASVNGMDSSLLPSQCVKV